LLALFWYPNVVLLEKVEQGREKKATEKERKTGFVLDTSDNQEVQRSLVKLGRKKKKKDIQKQKKARNAVSKL
jgi:hypothetical protein